MPRSLLKNGPLLASCYEHSAFVIRESNQNRTTHNWAETCLMKLIQRARPGTARIACAHRESASKTQSKRITSRSKNVIFAAPYIYHLAIAGRYQHGRYSQAMRYKRSNDWTALQPRKARNVCRCLIWCHLQQWKTKTNIKKSFAISSKCLKARWETF